MPIPISRLRPRPRPAIRAGPISRPSPRRTPEPRPTDMMNLKKWKWQKANQYQKILGINGMNG